MKKIKLMILAVVVVTGYNCKETKKEKQIEEVKAIASAKFNLVKDSTKVSFTAYKTSDKLPVGGKFTKIDITETNEGTNTLDALNGTTFSIPVSSLFTNDATGTRDPKLLEFFFGALENTIRITGKFKTSIDNKCSIDVTLNGKTANIPLEYTVTSENRYTFNGTMHLKNWNALNALASINKACETLHTGKDGISKTWEEVAVQAQVLLKKTE